MFGLEQDTHDNRYARGQEWLEVILRLWSEEVPFDYDGRYYRLQGVAGRPQPWGGRRPILMNAGNSVAGREFGARHCDLVFDQPHYLDQARDRIRSVRRVAREHGKEIQNLHLGRSGVPVNTKGGRRLFPLFRGRAPRRRRHRHHAQPLSQSRQSAGDDA